MGLEILGGQEPPKIRATNAIINASAREQKKLDNALLTITVGTLVISVTFITNIRGVAESTALPILFLAWIILIISLVSILLSYVFVQQFFKDILKEVDQWNGKGSFPSNNLVKNNCWRKLADLFTYMSLTLTIAGIICFTIFGYLNVRL